MQSINFNLQDMIFVISSPILTISFNFFSIETENFMHFSVFSLKQVNCRSSSFATSFLIKL